ncbi:MAG: hypothetical protein RMM10_12360, partial [Anaerolineae bacterium]|uniref:hypothetical protein n=1 Tax=Thermoflexus sp. TaxID=1969742 RepID=UPI0025D9A4F9
MKRRMYLGLYWGDEFDEPPKSPEQKMRDRDRVKELLERIGKGHLFREDQESYDLWLEVCKPAFHILMEELQKDPHLASCWFRVDRIYTPQELASAPLLLWSPTNQAIEDDWYDLKEGGYRGSPKASHRRCPACRAKLEQVRDLLVEVWKMGKRDLSMTYSYKVIVSARLAQRLQASGLTGFTFRPVWDYRRPYQGEPRLFQLVVTNVLPPMASPPTEFEEERRCEVCGTESRFRKHTHWWGRIRYYEETSVYYRKEVLEGAADLNRTVGLGEGLEVAQAYGVSSLGGWRWLGGEGGQGQTTTKGRAGAPTPNQ